MQCPIEHRLEHPRKIARRGVDDAQHFRRRGLLRQRLVTLGSELVPFGSRVGKLAPEIGDDFPRFASGCIELDRHASPIRQRRRLVEIRGSIGRIVCTG